MVTVFFVVASELTSGTMFIDVFNIGKAVVLIIFLVVALEGGIVTFDFQMTHI